MTHKLPDAAKAYRHKARKQLSIQDAFCIKHAEGKY